MLRTVIAVIVAGIVGTLANSVAVTAAFAAPFVPLAPSPGQRCRRQISRPGTQR